MKKTIGILLVAFCFACGTSANARRITFNEQEIEKVELKQRLDDSLCVELSKEQIGQISKAVDFNQHSKPTKTMVHYWLVVRQTNDSIRYYKITKEGLFGENDWFIRMKKKDFFENTWEKGSKVISRIPILD